MLALVATAANLLALVDNVYRGAKFLRQSVQDPRADAFYVRLITEDARYSEWRRRMGVETREDIDSLLLKLPRNARESLTVILDPLERYLKDAEKMFVKYGIGKPGKRHNKPGFRNNLKRIDFMIDGRREMGELLDTLKVCNDGLITIAPPAPGYHVSVTGSDPILETSQYRRSEEILQQTQQDQEPLAPSMQSRSSVDQDENSIVNDSSLRRDRAFRPIVELLYSTCSETLRMVAVRYPTAKPSFQDTADRLSLWGTGMFEGQIAIDQALNQRSEGIRRLKANISGILADLAVTLGKLFTTNCIIFKRKLYPHICEQGAILVHELLLLVNHSKLECSEFIITRTLRCSDIFS